MSSVGIIIAGVVAFTAIVLALVAIILSAKSVLSPGGSVQIEINGDASKTLTVPTGGKLLGTLADQKIFVPAACGGGGSCGQCKVRVLSGGGEILATEKAHMTRKEIKEGVRLACQTPVKQDMKIEIPPEIFDVKKWECVVRSNELVAPDITELILDLPEGEVVDFKAGGYIQIERPGGLTINYKTDFNIPEKYRAHWDRAKLWDLVSEDIGPVTRAYSMANYPGEKGIIMLDVRLAIPPAEKPGMPPFPGIPTGQMSSYLFSLKPGDKVTVSGPYGEFFVRDTPNEKIYIGRGAGMAPLRSHIYEMLEGLNRGEKISYWYNARSLAEAFYVEDFKKLEEKYPNFSFHLALSRPRPEDNWTGLTGYIYKVLYENYLKDHKAPEDCEYFLCGPPVMTDSVLELLDSLGVERESIFFDDFGE